MSEENKNSERDINLFIKRPKFAIVISLVFVLAGLIMMMGLPLEDYPSITPPQVVVNATYTGASADVVRDTIAAPIEAQLNGVEDMIYMTSTSKNGSYQLSVYFKVGTDPDMAVINVNNRLQLVTPRLPAEVRNYGLTVNKKRGGPGVLMIAVNSPTNAFDTLYITNYASIYIKDELARIQGVASVDVYGAAQYSMRIWLDPVKMANYNLSAICSLFLDLEQRSGHVLVQQHGQQGHHRALDHIQGGHAEEHEAADAVDGGVDVGAHLDDVFQRQVEQLGEFGQQVNGVEGAAEHRHHHRAHRQADHGAELGFAQMINNHRREHEAAAHHEIGKITHKGGGGALEQQLQQNFHTLAGHGGAGSKEETGQQHGNLGEVQLIEAGSQEGQGEVQHVQHGSQCGADADDADPAGDADLAQLGQLLFRQSGSHGQSDHDEKTHADEAQIVHDVGPEFAHFYTPLAKKSP